MRIMRFGITTLWVVALLPSPPQREEPLDYANCGIRSAGLWFVRGPHSLVAAELAIQPCAHERQVCDDVVFARNPRMLSRVVAGPALKRLTVYDLLRFDIG